MTGWLRLALAAQLLFFTGWGGQLLTSHRGADSVWLETEPVDPRDFLSGHYVALRFPIGRPAGKGCAVRAAAPREAVYVQLVPSGRTVASSEGPVEIWEAGTCRTDPPPSTTDDRWIVGTPERSTVRTLSYGIERFYVSETSPLRSARSGQVIAKVALNATFRPRILDLVPRLTPTATTP